MFVRDDELVSDILKLVSIKSFTGDQEGIRKCQRQYQKMAERMGFNSYYKANGKVLIVEPEGLNEVPEIGMVVHLDTVPFNEEDWTHNPLGEIWHGRLYGRGVVDDKAAAVIALHAVAKLKGKIKDSWQIIVGSDEEGKWSDMDDFLKESPILPKFLFTIDGDGIQYGCRGYLDLKLVFKRNMTNIPRLLDFKVSNPVNNMVPDRASANVDGQSYYGTGKSVHSSIPEKGKNALEDLTLQLSKNEDVVKEYEGFFKLMNNIFQTSAEKAIGLPDADKPCEDGCFTTVTPVNCELMLREFLTLTLNIRTCVHFDTEDLRTIVEYMSNEYGCMCCVEDLKLPGYIDPNSEYIKGMIKCYRSITGRKTKACVAKGTGYNAALPNCAIFGPRFDPKHDEIDYCHAVDENRKIGRLYAFMDMLVMYLGMML